MKESVCYLHAAVGFPVQESWIDAIKAGNYTTWPGITAETLADPYKGKTPLPRVPNYQEPFASRHPNTWNACPRC